MQALEDSALVYLTKLSKGELPGQLVETDIPVNPNTGYAMPGKVTNVYAHSSGGGKYMAVLQCKKTVHTDEGKQRQAALLAFSAFPELKHVILVDEDVDAEKWKDYFCPFQSF